MKTIILLLAILTGFSCSSNKSSSPIVYEGDEIKVFTQFGKVKVGVLAEALENGHKGDIIYARNLSSDKIIEVKLTGKDQDTVAVCKSLKVTRGDTINVHKSVGSLQVSITAKAMQDGQKGDLIKAFNLVSNKVLLVKISDKENAVVQP